MMVDGRDAALWNHTSSVLALIANTNRDPKKKPRPYSPGDFNPHAPARKRREPLSARTFADHVMAIVEGRKRRMQRRNGQ